MKKIVLLLSVLSLFTVTWADSTNSTTTDCITLSELRQKINNNEDVTQVNTGCITDMSKLFYNNSTFNQDISGWDVSSVVNMSKMFMIEGGNPDSTFNQPIGNWDVSNVTDMRFMFNNARSFNQPIGNWDVSNVTDMRFMFSVALKFNQPIGSWDVSSVRTMRYMFENAWMFNQPIGSWDVLNVTNMSNMFSSTKKFNQPIGNWNVSNVTSMWAMFHRARSFNQNIKNWNISNVTSHQHFEEDSLLQDSYNPFKQNSTPFTIELKAEGMMIEYTVLSSSVSVEEVRDSILNVIRETQSWGIPKMYKEHGENHNSDGGAYENLQHSLEEKGQHLTRKVYIIGVCNARKAKETAMALPSVTAMMPCRISVYEDGGKVKVSMMNATLPAFAPIADAMKGMIEGGITRAVQ